MFNKFPSIEAFHNLRKTVNKLELQTIKTYRGKIKLHGTNAGIRLISNEGEPVDSRNKVYAQSRTRIISGGDDNMAFAKWVEANEEYFASGNNFPESMTIFGEWCGKGIMKGVSISEIDKKVFAVFMIQFGDSDSDGATVIINPDVINSMIPSHPDIFVLPWYGKEIQVDFIDETNLLKAVDKLNEMVDTVEKCDPWVKEIFGITGTGEGIVFYPNSKNKISLREDVSNWIFKSKGEKHKVVKTKKAVQIDPEIVESVNAFVELVLPVARLEQGIRAVNDGELEFDIRKIGLFLIWIGQDVKKETKDELEASGLHWKQITKHLTNYARDWYFKKYKEI